MDNLFDLTGKVAVITGSSRGIGRAIALRMAQHGARVVVSSRKAEACEKVAAEIAALTTLQGKPGEAMVVPCNISDKAQLQQLVDTTLAAWGRIDILVCNAAVNPYFGPSRDIPDEAFDKIMHNNIKSNHWLCNMVAPDMAKRRDGAIIVISSVGGLFGSNMLGAYGISKAADMQLVRNLAVEWGGDNLRANCIAPGLIRTDFARALWENPEIAKKATKGYALKRVGEPDEIAGAAVMLASAAGRFLTGQTIIIDGGGMVNFQSV